MFIRDCYIRDADDILGATGSRSALKAALIVGPKGIGKTMFLNYLIVRIVEKARSENKCDALSIVYVHKPMDVAVGIRFTFTQSFCIINPGETADYYLSDSVDLNDGTMGRSLLLEVASENQTNYKKFNDRLTEMNGRRITMDVWTLDELTQVKHPSWSDDEVRFLYEVFGGRVRNVLGGDFDATDQDDVIEKTALWFFGDAVKQDYQASWNRALQLIRSTIADARGKTTKDELAIQTSLFWVINSSTGSGFSSMFLKLVAGRMKEDMGVSLWNELDNLLGGGGKGLMFEALGHMKLTQTNILPSSSPRCSFEA